MANVLSCLALFMAVSGVAYAATLGKNAVKAKNIAKSAVTTPKLKNGAVTAAKLKNGAVIGSKIANEAVGSAKLGPASVRSTALGGGVVTTAKLKDQAVTKEKVSASLLGTLVKGVSYVGKASETNETSPKSVTVDCPTGKQVVGGGARRVLGTSSEASLIESVPFVNGEGKRTGWTAAAASSGGTFAVEAVAICAEL